MSVPLWEILNVSDSFAQPTSHPHAQPNPTPPRKHTQAKGAKKLVHPLKLIIAPSLQAESSTVRCATLFQLRDLRVALVGPMAEARDQEDRVQKCHYEGKRGWCGLETARTTGAPQVGQPLRLRTAKFRCVTWMAVIINEKPQLARARCAGRRASRARALEPLVSSTRASLGQSG